MVHLHPKTSQQMFTIHDLLDLLDSRQGWHGARRFPGPSLEARLLDPASLRVALDIHPRLLVARLSDVQDGELFTRSGRHEAKVELPDGASGRSNPLSNRTDEWDMDSPSCRAFEIRSHLYAVEVRMLPSEGATRLRIEADLPELVPSAPAVEGEPNALRSDVPASVLLGATEPSAKVCEELDWTQGELFAVVGLHDVWDIADVAS